MGKIKNKVQMIKYILKMNSVWVINIILPIVIGAIIYYLISPEVIFAKQIDDFAGGNFHITDLKMNNQIIRFIRNYFPDMLWGYALVFALFFALGNNAADIWKTFLIAFSFSTAIEILQITPIAKGTFDVWDILVEFLAEVIAVFIINILRLRRKFK